MYRTIILEDIECSFYSILLFVSTSSHEHWRTDLAQGLDIRAWHWIRHGVLVASWFLMWLFVLILEASNLIITPKHSLESRVFSHVLLVFTVIQWSHWSSKVVLRISFTTALFRWNFHIVQLQLISFLNRVDHTSGILGWRHIDDKLCELIDGQFKLFC